MSDLVKLVLAAAAGVVLVLSVWDAVFAKEETVVDAYVMARVQVFDGQRAELVYVRSSGHCFMEITGAGDDKTHIKPVPCPDFRDFFGVRGLAEPQKAPPEPKSREWSA